ncbi:site-specific integrase [Vibrio ishigakensis]|uniref:site-specific integrase n=1 Tax=Vibrio ishigakensis TaxID=1481914 RepID=UPI0021C29FCA|nr:site-specific integrase [Vibrio ishigakensis]
MSKFTAQQKRNRANNSGGVAPDAQLIATTLAIALHRIHRKGDSETVRKRKVACFLIWWMTHELLDIEAIGNLPRLKRVTGNSECQPHALRPVRMNNISWIEYANAYLVKGAVEYLWQPIPDAFISLFIDALPSGSSSPLLTEKQHKALCEDLGRKWKTLGKLSSHARVRKDRLFRYWLHMGQSDPKLSTIAKSVMLTRHQDHHHSAKAYQREGSDKIRFKIFEAHNRYVKRLVDAIRLHELKGYFPFQFEQRVKRPQYLMQSGSIPQLERRQQNGTYTHVPAEPIYVGSDRALSVDEVRQFFHSLSDAVREAHCDTWTKESLRHYYNLRTYQITFQFLILTGVRPTHAISIEASQCFDCRHAMVRDKGRYRTVWLCDFFSHALKEYLAVQHIITLHLSLKPKTNSLWYLLDEDINAVNLNAKTLRTAIQSFSANPNVVPYQLRHSFAQMALTANFPALTTQQIDRLMGHSEFGEHLGSEQVFPASKEAVHAHLNQLASLLGLDAPDTFRSTFLHQNQLAKEAQHDI